MPAIANLLPHGRDWDINYGCRRGGPGVKLRRKVGVVYKVVVGAW